LRSAKRSRQRDSCPRGSQSARGRPRARPQTRWHQREADCCSMRAREVEPDRKGLDRAAAKLEARAAAPRRAAGQLAEGHPRPARAGAVAAAEREGRHEQAEAQLLLPTDCRKTGKTCWWAGSRRRTACTRSCEKLPSSSYGALTCASLAPGSIPVLLRHYAVKGGRTGSETIRAAYLSGAPDKQNGAEFTIQPRFCWRLQRASTEMSHRWAVTGNFSGLSRLGCGRPCPTDHASNRGGHGEPRP